jgi:SAM-dependent methyltransferase
MTQAVPRPWQLVGDMGQNYEQYFVPAIFEPWGTDLLDLVSPREGDRVLDVACATGIVARLASMRVGASTRVVGLDFNPVMLAAARSAAPASSSIEWEQANAEDMPLPDDSFDLVLCQQGLQFFPNKPVALREMHRVLAPRGRLALSVWCDIHDIPGYIALAEALAQHVSPEAAGFMHMTGSLSPAELQGLLEEANFQDVIVRPQSKNLRFKSPEAFVWEVVQATPLAWMSSVNQADDSTRAIVVNELSERLQPYLDNDGLAFPIEASVATARKGSP